MITINTEILVTIQIKASASQDLANLKELATMLPNIKGLATSAGTMAAAQTLSDALMKAL